MCFDFPPWCNGWCSGRRYQDRSGSCDLCVDCSGEDSLEHHAVCTYQWGFFTRTLRQPVGRLTLARFMALEDGHVENMVMQACQVYAVKRAIDIRHKQGTIRGALWTPRLLLEGHRTAALHHASLAQRYARLWSPNRPVLSPARKRHMCSTCGLEMYECDCKEGMSESD